MKNLLTMMLFALVACCSAAAENGPIFSTTIDFLDYVFYDKRGPAEYYPVEVYEQRLKEIAECGIKKVYLRVNCLGLTLYPTKVARLYGEDGAMHWGKEHEYGAKRLVNTVRRYDVCKETIRIAHKYGMEAWAWESLVDDGGTQDNTSDKGLAAKYQNRPLLDPYFLAHPEGLAMRSPKDFISPEKAARINAEARKFPVGKIVLHSSNTSGRETPLQVSADTLAIYTSKDNDAYKRYEKPFKFSAEKNSNGLYTITISGLSITDPYVKLVHTKKMGSNEWVIAIHKWRGQNEVYNTRGQKIVSVWGGNINDKTPELAGETGSLSFDMRWPAAWDCYGREIGFMIGLPKIDWNNYFTIAEFTVPGTMAHKVARFAELAAYPFDGYMLNWRTHSRVSDPNEYGFNPEVRAKFKKRFGKDIWRDKFNLADLLTLRVEAIGDYYRECKKLIGNRPLYVTGLVPVPAGQRAPQGEFKGMGVAMLDNMPMQYKRWITEGSIDGVMMTGGDFPQIFTAELTGGKPIKLGVFREASGHLHSHRPKNYDFAKDVKTLSRRHDIDEVELYETLELTNHPEKRQVLREVTGGAEF